MLRVAAVVEQCWHRVPGGTAVAAVETLAAVEARGDVELVGVGATHRRGSTPDPQPPIPVRRVPLPRRVLYDAWHGVRFPPVRWFTGKVDVVHATGGVVPPHSAAPLVATIHDLAFLHRPDWFTPRGVRFATRAFNLARARAALVIASSQATARDLQEHGIDADRTRVAPLGVRSLVSPVGPDVVRKRYGLPETFALWVGTAEPRKNLKGLLAAAELTTSAVPLVLVGPTGWGMDLEALCARARCEIIPVGFVNTEDLSALYAAARVFVYPSLMEGFGLPVLEAMAQGTPVITSAGTATAEICADPAALVDPLDAEALACAIDAVVLDDAEHHRRSVDAVARAAEFTWGRTAAEVVAAYEDAAR